jgi:hypothetical protein
MGLTWTGSCAPIPIALSGQLDLCMGSGCQ